MALGEFHICSDRSLKSLRTGRAAGISLIEVLIAITFVGLLVSLLVPAIQAARERARAVQCINHLRQVGVALQAYHEAHGKLPPAVIWGPPGEPLGGSIAPPGTIDRVSIGSAALGDEDRVFSNWAIAILPFLEEISTGELFKPNVPLADAANASAVMTELSVMKCPSDPWSNTENYFRRSPLPAVQRPYGRGNYAINAGTNDACLTDAPPVMGGYACKDGFSVNGTNLKTNTSQVWGSGIAGVNKSFSYREFSSGLSKTIAIDEIRAGIDARDRRGVWALGFPGSSIVAGHGIHGNRGPNAGYDYMQGCGELPLATLASQSIPCRSSSVLGQEISSQATARSLHSGGVNIMMADGSVHFVADAVDATIWHEMHRRDHQMSYEMPF